MAGAGLELVLLEGEAHGGRKRMKRRIVSVPPTPLVRTDRIRLARRVSTLLLLLVLDLRFRCRNVRLRRSRHVHP